MSDSLPRAMQEPLSLERPLQPEKQDWEQGALLLPGDMEATTGEPLATPSAQIPSTDISSTMPATSQQHSGSVAPAVTSLEGTEPGTAVVSYQDIRRKSLSAFVVYPPEPGSSSSTVLTPSRRSSRSSMIGGSRHTSISTFEPKASLLSPQPSPRLQGAAILDWAPHSETKPHEAQLGFLPTSLAETSSQRVSVGANPRAQHGTSRSGSCSSVQIELEMTMQAGGRPVDIAIEVVDPVPAHKGVGDAHETCTTSYASDEDLSSLAAGSTLPNKAGSVELAGSGGVHPNTATIDCLHGSDNMMQEAEARWGRSRMQSCSTESKGMSSKSFQRTRARPASSIHVGARHPPPGPTAAHNQQEEADCISPAQQVLQGRMEAACASGAEGLDAGAGQASTTLSPVSFAGSRRSGLFHSQETTPNAGWVQGQCRSAENARSSEDVNSKAIRSRPQEAPALSQIPSNVVVPRLHIPTPSARPRLRPQSAVPGRRTSPAMARDAAGDL